MKKGVSVFFCLICMFLLGGVAGCSQKNEPEKLTIWAYDQYITAAQMAIDKYKTVNPELGFELVELSQDDMVQKLRIALASGSKENLPDILVEEDYNMKGYFEYYEDYFVDLAPYVDKSKFVNYKIENSSYEGKLYALPYDNGSAALFYRIDYINQAGYEEADLQDITWDDFIRIGKEVQKESGVHMLPVSPEGNIEGRVILQSGGSWYFDQQGNLNIEENQVLRDTMETLKDLFVSDVALQVYAWDEIMASIYDGSVASVIGNCTWAPLIAQNEEQKGLWRVAPIPRMTGDERYNNYSCISGNGWLVLNKEHSENSIDFIMKTFATDTDLINELIKSTQMVPVLKEAFYVPNAVAGDPFFGRQNLCQLMAEWGEHIEYVNYAAHSYEILYANGVLSVDYLNGKESLDDLLAKLQKQAEEIVATDTK